MAEKPDTTGTEPQRGNYQPVALVPGAEATQTNISTSQVRTVPTRLMEGNVSLRYSPRDQSSLAGIDTSK